RVGGIDLNKPRIRAALTAVLALAAAPGGFTVADLAARVHTMTLLANSLRASGDLVRRVVVVPAASGLMIVRRSVPLFPGRGMV
ncbi:MAG: hypothetical protein ACRDS0_37550, partial [Pseudonocardiaceae bacterium]